MISKQQWWAGPPQNRGVWVYAQPYIDKTLSDIKWVKRTVKQHNCQKLFPGAPPFTNPRSNTNVVCDIGMVYQIANALEQIAITGLIAMYTGCWIVKTFIATMLSQLATLLYMVCTVKGSVTVSILAYLWWDLNGKFVQSCVFLNLPQSLSPFPYDTSYWSGWDLKLMRRVARLICDDRVSASHYNPPLIHISSCTHKGWELSSFRLLL